MARTPIMLGSRSARPPRPDFLRIGETRIETTGVLGRWTDGKGEEQTWAFPGWATIPTTYSLADGRRWHFLFAWVLAISLTLYMLWSLLGGHLKKDLHVRRAEWAPRHIWQDIKDHARLRFPRGEAAARYHILQKLSYIGVIFVLLPLMIATGLTMSPGMNASAPWLLDLFGGRQSARSIHFLAAWTLVAFFIVHIVMVLLAGPVNESPLDGHRMVSLCRPSETARRDERDPPPAPPVDRPRRRARRRSGGAASVDGLRRDQRGAGGAQDPVDG